MQRPKRLSAVFVKTVNTPGRYGDGRGGFGLSLLVKESSTGRFAKSWSQRLRINRQPFNVGLGGYPIVTLARARELALENSRAVEAGGDPRVKPETVPTFSECVDRAVDVMRPNWKHPRTEHQLRFFLTKHALPHIGRKAIDQITPGDVLEFLAPLAISTPASARKTKAALRQVFQWSVALGLRQGNPADANISHALPKLAAKEHHKALPFSEVGRALETVRNTGAWLGTKLAFEFMVLVAARSGEVRLAEWSEIDLEGRLWTIPAGRMKSGKMHRVPLSTQALAVLENANQLSDGIGLVFPSANGKAMTDSTLSKLLRENEIAAVPHGFRSSFRDWCAEQNIDRQVAESALAHSVGDATEAAYLRSDVLALRRAAMDAWGDDITTSRIS